MGVISFAVIVNKKRRLMRARLF